MYRYLALSILTYLICMAQVEDFQPAASNVLGAEYPRVHSDLRVTFRLKATAAKVVKLHPAGDGLGKQDLDMVKGADGFWSVTTDFAARLRLYATRL
jgi:enterochelin esterase family protein